MKFQAPRQASWGEKNIWELLLPASRWGNPCGKSFMSLWDSLDSDEMGGGEG